RSPRRPARAPYRELEARGYAATCGPRHGWATVIATLESRPAFFAKDSLGHDASHPLRRDKPRPVQWSAPLAGRGAGRYETSMPNAPGSVVSPEGLQAPSRSFSIRVSSWPTVRRKISQRVAIASVICSREPLQKI